VGELGSLFWDFNSKTVRWYDSASKKWTTYSQPDTWELNQMYVDEMKHFVECVEQKRPTMLPISEAARLMRVVFAAKDSARQKMVPVGEASA
jgi:predicted dehydrogenase